MAEATDAWAVEAPAVPVATGVERLDSIIWSLIVASFALVAASVPLGGFRLDWHSFGGPAASIAVMLFGIWLYRRVRPDPKLAAALTCTAQLIAFAAVGAPLSYVATALAAPIPLQDGLLDSIDKAFGFDWAALLAWMNAHNALDPILHLAYASITLQGSIVILALAFTGRMVALRRFLLAFIIAALIAIAVAAVVPAHGAWAHYHVQPQDFANLDPAARDLSVPIVHGLRAGTDRALLAIGAEGIVTFPSLHAAFAVILAAGFWPVRKLRWLGLTSNGLMLASTPIHGSHYLIDIVAGLAVAALALAIARDLTRRATSRSSCPVPAISR